MFDVWHPLHIVRSDASLFYRIYYYLKFIFKWIRNKIFTIDYVIADLRDGRILVQDVNVKGLKLWREGFFGKGTLSRGAPTWAYRMHLDDQSESLYQARNKKVYIETTSEDYILSPEEAFYLCAIDRLKIFRGPGSSYQTLTQLWDYFSMKSDDTFDDYEELAPRFPIRFAVYHYYRYKKWVVRPGLKYGADFVLYKKGPSLDHSKYLVVIMPTIDETAPLNRDWKWALLMSRLSSQVKKKLVICFVLLPTDFQASKLLQIDILFRIKIWDVEISRWVPNRSA
jgi:tRNA-splicing endonuclease subunit Sen2